jgi:hypothetical protein
MTLKNVGAATAVVLGAMTLKAAHSYIRYKKTQMKHKQYHLESAIRAAELELKDHSGLLKVLKADEEEAKLGKKGWIGRHEVDPVAVEAAIALVQHTEKEVEEATRAVEKAKKDLANFKAEALALLAHNMPLLRRGKTKAVEEHRVRRLHAQKAVHEQRVRRLHSHVDELSEDDTVAYVKARRISQTRKDLAQKKKGGTQKRRGANVRRRS